MTAILGISAFYHDSAAALLVDGEIVAAAQEERFSRVKHDRSFPRQALEYCLRHAGLDAADLDHVVFYEKPLLKFERLLETYLATAPGGFRAFREGLPGWLQEKLLSSRVMNRGLGGKYRRPYVFVEHHESHAASAFFPSPFEDAAILVADGVGEWATATLGVGEGNRIDLTHEMRFPHSLGLLYSAFTYFCGFRVNSGEYKLMGLAPYGRPSYEDLIRRELIDLKTDGSFRLKTENFNFISGLTMTGRRFERLFGGPPRRPESPLTEREFDLAASIQAIAEDVLQRMARHLSAVTGKRNLCLAGGVALNCVANGRILRDSPFDRVWVQPAAGDAGGALGAAWMVWHQLLGRTRRPAATDRQHGSLLGPDASPEGIEEVLRGAGARYRRMESEEDLVDATADLIASGKVVGWMQGRMEFGPRALGNRSILADARDPDMQSRLNLKIKFRESFRPFAPIVLAERACEYFELGPDEESPYMMVTTDVRAEKRLPLASIPGRVLPQICEAHSVLPAVTHVDGSARLQTVDRGRNPRLHHLLRAFERKTGCPVMINTSFNIRGEPMVNSPSDAYRCFIATGMDALVMGDFVVTKDAAYGMQPAAAAEYVSRYGMD